MTRTLPALPLFPLHAVLFPGGLLPLRIFESRYMDMARDCLRNQTPFGVSLIRVGKEVADSPGCSIPAAVPEEIGCLAEIIDCDMTEPGILLLRTRGSQRIRISHVTTERNGLLRGDAVTLADDVGDPVAEDLDICVRALRKIISKFANDPQTSPFLSPYAWEDASWVSNRLCEVLPIPMRTRQKLMALDNVGARLALVKDYLSQHKIP